MSELVLYRVDVTLTMCSVKVVYIRIFTYGGSGSAEARHNLVRRSIVPLVTRLARIDGLPPEWARLTWEVELITYRGRLAAGLPGPHRPSVG